MIDFLLIVLLLVVFYFSLLEVHATFFKDYTQEDIKLFLNKLSDIIFISSMISLAISIFLRFINFNIKDFNSGVFMLTLLFFVSVSFLYDIFILAYKKELHPKTDTGGQWVEKKYVKSINSSIKISIVRSLTSLVISFSIYSIFNIVVNQVVTYICCSLAFFLIVIKIYYFLQNHKKSNFIVEFGAGIIPSPYILPITLFLVLSGHFWFAIFFAFLGGLVLEFIAIKKAVKAKKLKKKKPHIVDRIANNFPQLTQHFLYFFLICCVVGYPIYLLLSGDTTFICEINDFLLNPLKHQ